MFHRSVLITPLNPYNRPARRHDSSHMTNEVLREKKLAKVIWLVKGSSPCLEWGAVMP